MSITYYGLFGLNQKKPSGLFREIENQAEKELHYERLDNKGDWINDPDMARYLNGYADEAEEITEAEALRFISLTTSKARSP